MPIAVVALAVSMFAVGTTEFVIVGLLPTIAEHLDVSISTIGLVVTAYALGIAVGGSLITAWPARVPRKPLLLALMTLFVAGIWRVDSRRASPCCSSRVWRRPSATQRSPAPASRSLSASSRSAVKARRPP